MRRAILYSVLTLLMLAGLSPILTGQPVNYLTSAMLQARAWSFSALQTFSGGLKIVGSNLEGDTKSLDPDNLLDKTAEETVAGRWTFTGQQAFAGGVRSVGPAAMVTLQLDCHVTETVPDTCAGATQTLFDTYKIPVTAFVQRSPDVVEDITNAQLASLAADPLYEIGLHSVDHRGWFPGALSFSGGQAALSTDGTVRGGMTEWITSQAPWNNIGVNDAFVWLSRQPQNDPRLITSIADDTTLTLNSVAGLFFRRVASYAIVDGYNAGTVTVDGSPTPSAILTGTGTGWTDTLSGPIQKARASGKGSMVIVNGAPSNPYYVVSVNTALQQITLDKSIDVDLTNVAYAIVMSPEAARDQWELNRAELRNDSGKPTLPLTAFSAPNNGWGPYLVGAARSAGITSATTRSGIVSPYHFYNGSFNPLLYYSVASSGRTTSLDLIGMSEAAIDSGSWLSVDLERVRADKTTAGTVSTDATTQVTGSGTAFASTGVGAGDFIFIDGASRGYSIASRSGEVLTLTETLDAADQDLSGRTFYVSSSATASDGFSAPYGAVQRYLSWLDANRQRIMPMKTSDAVARAASLASTSSAVNLVANPRFRVTNTLAFSGVSSASNRWSPWSAAPGSDRNRLQEEKDADGEPVGIKMVHTSVLTDTVGTPLLDLLPGKVYQVTGEIDVQALTGTPTRIQIRVDRIYNYGISRYGFPEERVTAVGRYPINFTFDTFAKPISAAVDAAAAASSFPFGAPKDHVQVVSHTAGSGVYVLRHPLHETVSGVPNAVVSSGTSDVACTAASTEPHSTTVTCRTISGTPAPSDADFQLALPHTAISPIKMAGAHPILEVEFNGQGTVVFRNIAVREAGAQVIGM